LREQKQRLYVASLRSQDGFEGVILTHGQRPEAEALFGAVNTLCSDRLSDMGGGARRQSTFLDVEAWETSPRSPAAESSLRPVAVGAARP
jgi:hypothetical protein